MALRSDANHSLSAWLRGQHEAKSAMPVLTSMGLEELTASLPTYRVSEKLLLLLRSIERQTEIAGKPVFVVPEHDCALAWCSTAEEFNFLLASLVQRGFVVSGDVPEANLLEDSFAHDVTITVAGWEHLEKQDHASVFSNQAFVAMWFDASMKPAYDLGIHPALKRAGFGAYRVDATPHLDRIDVKIMAEIKNSRFLVADVTGQRQGVYFEAGYALGLGLPVFWCVREDELSKVHFDTKQYNHIVWQTEAELADKLHDYVVAIVGHGSAKP